MRLDLESPLLFFSVREYILSVLSYLSVCLSNHPLALFKFAWRPYRPKHVDLVAFTK